MSKTSPLVIVFLILLLSGCALNNYTIESPSYKPTLQKLENSKNILVFTKIEYQPVIPNDPKAVGLKKNGYGNETARLYFSDNVSDWFKKSFDDEFRAAGFSIVESKNNDAVKITLNVRQFFVEPWVGFWSADVIGILKIEAQVDIPNKNSYYVRKFVTYDKLTTIVWPDNIKETRLMNVVQKSIPEVVNEIRLLLAKN